MNLSFLRTIILATTLTFAFCNKSEIAPVISTDKLIGKWNWISQVTWYKPIGSNITYKDTNFIRSGDYVEFRSNSKYIWKDSYGIDSGKYLISGTKLLFSSGVTVDSFEIKTLTDNSLSLYVNTTPGSEEIWSNFKK